MKKIGYVLLAAALLLVCSGCISQEDYDALAAERTQLQEQVTQLEAAAAQQEEQIAALQSYIGEQAQEIEELQSALKAAEKSAADKDGTIRELKNALNETKNSKPEGPTVQTVIQSAGNKAGDAKDQIVSAVGGAKDQVADTVANVWGSIKDKIPNQ